MKKLRSTENEKHTSAHLSNAKLSILILDVSKLNEKTFKG